MHYFVQNYVFCITRFESIATENFCRAIQAGLSSVLWKTAAGFSPESPHLVPAAPNPASLMSTHVFPTTYLGSGRRYGLSDLD